MPVSTALIALVAVVVVGIMFMRSSSADAARRLALEKSTDLEKRLTEAQKDLQSIREDVKHKVLQLEEARDSARKAKRKENREEKAANVPVKGPDPAQLAKYAAAVESAERRAKSAEQKAAEMVEAARVALRKELDAELDGLRRKLSAQEAKAQAAKEAQAAKPVEAAPRVETPKPQRTPELKGVRINLKELAPEVIDELARFMRRAQNAEKLLLVTDGEREVLADKLEEIQRRYFAVCRELALVAVNAGKPKEMSNEEAARLANDVVSASEEASRRRAHRHPGPKGPEKRHEAGEAKVAAPAGEKREGDKREHQGPRRNRPDRPERGPRPEGGKHADAKPGDAKPAAVKAPENKPADAPAAPAATTADAKPAAVAAPESKPADAPAPESKPVDAPAPEIKPVEAKPAEMAAEKKAETAPTAEG